MNNRASHGVLDALTANDTLGRRIQSFSEESFSGPPFGDPFENIKSKPHVTSQLGWNWNQKWRLFSPRKNDDANKERSEQYTSTTLKNRRREVRELLRMSQKRELISHQVRKSRHRNRRDSKESNVMRNESREGIQCNPNEAETNCNSNNYGTRSRKADDCDNLPPDVNRNGRMSVRGTRVFGRRKMRHRLEGHMFEADLCKKSFSLPAELHTCHPTDDDDEYWSAGFVQSRVRRLEEDLASSKWHERYTHYDFEVQSLCSLDLGRMIRPDSDDYRIAYLSSVGTSLDSSLDYMEDGISALGPSGMHDLSEGGMGTLDVRPRKRDDAMEEIHEDDWDMSLNSCEENEGSFSSSEDEFEFVRVGGTREGEHQYVDSQKNVEEGRDSLVVGSHHTKIESDDNCDRNFDDLIKTEMLDPVLEPVEVNDVIDCSETHQNDIFENIENLNNTINNYREINRNTKDANSSITDDSEISINSETNNFETLKEDYIDCEEDHDTKKSLENEQIQFNKDEGNDLIQNSFNSAINNTHPIDSTHPINPINLSEKVTETSQKQIPNQVLELENCTKKIIVKDNASFYASEFSSERLVKQNNFIKNPKFINKRKSWHHKIPSVSFEPFFKLTEMFDYEPLSTPFAEIYAISCNIPFIPPLVRDDLSKIKESVTENVYSNENVLNNEIYNGVYSNVKFIPVKISFNNHTFIENSVENILKRIKFNHVTLLYPPFEVYEVHMVTKCFLSNLIEIYKIDIYRTLTNAVSCLPLVGTSFECPPPFWKKDFGEDYYDTHFNFNLKIFSPKYHPFYTFGTKLFLQNFRARPNEACLCYPPNVYNFQVRSNKQHKINQALGSVPRNLFEHRNANFVVDSHNKIHISQLEIPVEKLPFYDENHFNNYTDTPISKFYNFHLSKRRIIPVLHLVAKDNARGRNKLQPNSHLHKLMKLHPPLGKPHLRKRNYLIRSDLCRSETRLVASEIPPAESGLFTQQQLATSQSCQATCAVESLRCCQSPYECSEAGRLFSGFVTVPAVERVAERESCCSRPTTADGARTAEDRNNQKSAALRNEILDYAETRHTLDKPPRNNGDYCFTEFGYSPKSSANTLLIVATRDGVNSSDHRCCCCSTDMATCDAEQPRSLGKHVRAQGKNISKLMRLFDSDNRSNPVRKSEDCRTRIGVAQQCVMDNHQTTEVSAQNGVEARGEKKALDNSSATDGSANEVKSEKSPSDIPYCRKVPNGGGLWENVNIGSTNGNDGLWNTLQNHNQIKDASHSPVSSTIELNNLIAVSKAELSKFQEPSPSDKSNLENYFTSFESYKSEESSVPNNNAAEFHDNPFRSSYDCDMNEMSFEDEEAAMSDTSSDEDLRPRPAMTNTNYLPAYALHTIIEESCEESERDSRTTTPTNDANTSKLERYFSWDIINDAEVNQRKKSDDQSTVYSDSLSESSGSLIADDVKDIDPSHLASSRLEKYFTSGLVDDQNYFYPDDAEFLDDAPVSDFEEDSIHQKISRSALLSSLETMPTLNDACVPADLAEIQESESILESKCDDLELTESPLSEVTVAKLDDNCDNVGESSESIPETSQSLTNIADDEDCSKDTDLSLPNVENVIATKVTDIPPPSSVTSECEIAINQPVLAVEVEPSPNIRNEAASDDAIGKNAEPVVQKPGVNKDQLAIDIQAIIKKLLSYFSSETGAESFKDDVETDYISAWQLLETEIERLLQSISPNGLESCSSSTIDSNNSDYGSDTVESMDCMTDEDDGVDAKVSAKCPLVDMLSSAYKIQSEPDLSSFNISDETLNIWKRLIMSLQRDNSVLSENEVCDPTAEARSYIRDQIVTLMHTVTVNDSLPEIVKPVDAFRDKNALHSLEKESEFSVEINEAFNTNLGNSDILTHKVHFNEITKIHKEDGTSSDNPEQDHPSNLSTLKDSNSVSDINTEISCKSVSDDVDSRKVSCDSDGDAENVDSPVPDRVNSKPVAIGPRTQSEHVLSREAPSKESPLKFSVVAIELDEGNCGPDRPACREDASAIASQSSLPESTEIFSVPFPFGGTDESRASASRDTGYRSFESSDDSLPNTLDVPDFKSLKRSIKKFPLSSSTLSKSSSNILQAFSAADAKFSTLQLKPKKAKSTSGTSSPKFSSLFSPSSVLKRLTGNKNNEAASAESSSIPPKYLKKYARSASVDNESLFGAVSMPVLTTPRPGDSYSALGLYSENDRDSSLTLDEAEAKRYFSGSQSVLSLGAHSASMTSVYSTSGCQYVPVSGDVLFGLNYNHKSQTMEVFVKQCRNLAATDVRQNRSNPYVKVYLLPDKTRSGKRKTKTKKNTVNPVFNELLRFPVSQGDLESRTLWLSVWNSDVFGRNDFLGEMSLPLGHRLLDSPTLRWYPLQERVESVSRSPLGVWRGELFLALKYVPRDLSLETRFRPAPVISQRGALHVLLKEARSGKSMDAFCKSYLLPDKSKATKQKTPVVRRSGHPKWYHTVIYEDLSLDELRGERSLELTLWDHDTLANNRFRGGVRLNAGSGLYHGLSVDWMDARREESSLWLSMLESPNMWVDGCLTLRPTMTLFHNNNT